MSHEFNSGGQCMPDVTGELLSALDHVFLSIIKLDLDSGTAILLQNASHQEHLGCSFQWESYLDFHGTLLEQDEADKLSKALSTVRLRELCEAGQKLYRSDFSYRPETGLDWMEVFTCFECTEGGSIAYVLTRQSSDNYLLHRIVTQYIYNHCDCFYLLDAKNNSYTMFSGKTDVPRPVDVCQDYDAESIRFGQQFVVPEDRERVIRDMGLDRVTAALEHQEVYAFTCGMWDETGNYTYKRMEYRYYDRGRKQILLSRTDITDLYMENLRHTKALDVAIKRAQTDPLTGLLNYQGIRDVVKLELARNPKHAALLFLDLDDFKQINDTYGHNTGDNALRLVSKILLENANPTDYVARVGGDEFVIFLSSIHSADSAVAYAQNTCNQLAQRNLEGTNIQLSCSIGVAIAPDEGSDYESLSQNADRKVYQAKADGKNQFTL